MSDRDDLSDLPSPLRQVCALDFSGEVLLMREADQAVFEQRQLSWKEGRSTPPRRVSGDPLEYYGRQRTISGAQLAAGRRLRNDFERSGVCTVATAKLTRGTGAGTMDPDRMVKNVAAWESYRKGMESAGRVGRVYLRRVICWGEWAADVAKSTGGKDRYGIERLREALDDLRLHYRQRERDGG